MKPWQKYLVVVVSFIVILSAAFVVWGSTPARPMPQALEALQSDAKVTVTTGDWLTFKPASGIYSTGFIFYPGGRVDYRAYAPMAHELATRGFLVVIPRMPLNLAVFGIEKAADVIKSDAQVKHWVIGGHSLGGSMAADYLFKHPADFAGLVFLASYPANSDNLKDYAGRVLSISGSLDGLATPEKIKASRTLLPASANFVVIEGGDHAYFGWYGPQSGDNPATISREEQQKVVVDRIAELLAEVGK
jgi:pimeloyl-ACP methyl ester carboxylesterase